MHEVIDEKITYTNKEVLKGEPMPKITMVAASPAVIKINYTNWRGVTAIRTISPVSMTFCESEYHPGRHMFLIAVDLDKKEFRKFKVSDIHEWIEV